MSDPRHPHVTAGYIVTEPGSNRTTTLSAQTGVLMRGSAFTLFPTKEAAHDAIARTGAYTRKHGYDWNTYNWCVTRVVTTRQDV